MSAPRKPNPLRPPRLILLSLPGAAMWSLPIGLWLQSRFAPGLLPNLDFEFFLLIATTCMPVVAVCSFCGVIESVEKGEAFALKGVFFGFFNLISFFFSAGATFLGVVTVISRFS